LCGGGCGRLPAGADRLDDREHVVTGDPSTTASADDLLGTEAVLSEEAAGGIRASASPFAAGAAVAVGAGAVAAAAAGAGAAAAGAGAATVAADDPFGDSSEPAGPGTSADGASSGAAAAAAGAGAGADASFASAGPEPLLAPSSAVSMTAISALFGTVAPSSARISFRTPSNGDGTSALTLSVMTSSSGSYLSTWSPGCLS